ncbi:MAG: CDP-diacylglycerol--glycerol-3-phosphate 3-phosphatidyltransferase [Robiginitomaculum sp.]|nr:MAG: CDP-diacylglycerol--glycerol-3-phosphate 3-phosphatidyltransferase [Robiginitomaculum sp.]
MSSSQSRHKFYWLPNALTLSRIAVIPILIWGILALGGNIESALNGPFLVVFIFIVCAFTDFLDGYLARKWGLVSDFGRMLDPIADKLLVAGCLIAFMISFGPIWYVLVPSIAIIFRDIFISGTREHAALSGITMPPTNLAKWKTAAEMLAILLLLIGISTREMLPISGMIPEISGYAMKAGLGCLWLAAFLSVYTGLHYIRAAFK